MDLIVQKIFISIHKSHHS